jgi:hypothetical protein
MTGHLAIVLPGRGYTSLGPALRLPRLAVEEAGARVVEVNYPTVPGDEGGSWALLYEAVAEEISSLVAGGPDELTFIAKSLGTVLLAALSEDVRLPSSVRAIWVTPILAEEPVRSGVIAKRWSSLLVAGGADTFHHPDHHRAVVDAIGASSLVLPGADHRLEVPGNVMATLGGFRAFTEAVMAFVC